MEQEPMSISDDRQPFHKVNGKMLDQREWRDRLRDATALFDAFKLQAYRDGEI